MAIGGMSRFSRLGKLCFQGWQAPPTVSITTTRGDLHMAHEILFCEAEAVFTAPAFHADNVID